KPSFRPIVFEQVITVQFFFHREGHEGTRRVKNLDRLSFILLLFFVFLSVLRGEKNSIPQTWFGLTAI
ncbi:MAG: hypothetical protein PHO79_08650, partial [Desulfoplanes sp.]|nr:hypothetical protein [Desulfoplanes sp.]